MTEQKKTAQAEPQPAEQTEPQQQPAPTSVEEAAEQGREFYDPNQAAADQQAEDNPNA